MLFFDVVSERLSQNALTKQEDVYFCSLVGSKMIPIQFIKSFLDQATAQGSRSTVLRPLGWIVAICAGATLAAVKFNASNWIILLFGVAAGLGIMLYLGSYIYCLATGREDLLRSETYSIQKLAIEKGFVGDSLAGVFRSKPGDQLATAMGKDEAAGEK